ncbi:Orn/Lys/Arg decarboxylase N-terminal domain-containing protein [Maridesulfovibrio sp.]|uniref:Orn/Lys/Arg family decarboxylase n=1 Tax=Maridesulfovibrio sp. TaxID=2795000 RepID=UPI0029F53B28|nr:Orn/Lys/Arg decarboxylase N-terminal domain-containing protein [Maridesulfovibrio sp.]
MKITRHMWPVLIVSAQFDAKTDEGLRLRNLEEELTQEQECSVYPSYSYEDAAEIFISRADLGAVVIDWDINFERYSEDEGPEYLLKEIRKRNKNIPIFLLTERITMANIPTDVLAQINECLWKTADTAEFLAGRIETRLVEYVQSVFPIFFGEMVKYSEAYKYAWHTPGHMGGEGFLKSPAGVAMHKFYGENVFRSDLSISVPELGSLLDHSGVVGNAEKNSARVFGADHTYYVLNGTSNVNQIIWRSQLVRDDIAFVDRNCHKSLNYAMVITDAYPIYMVPRRNKRGIIGPCRLSEFSEESIQTKVRENSLIPEELKEQSVRMSALTNSTYDGVCYNVINIKKQLQKSVDNLHFDEAWYAYARFHPMYKDHFGMADDDLNEHHPPIFCSHSTHKLLTAFSQASMLHVRDGSSIKIDPDELNESYMMHGSTSPQYSMIASLDVATKMMEDSGEVLMHDTMVEAVNLRKKVSMIASEMKEKDSWFFEMWQPEKVLVGKDYKKFEDVDTEYLCTHQHPWVFTAEDNWHGFEDMEEEYAMLDPIKLTFTTPGLRHDGSMEDEGIPASIVTDYLINHGIVCEKTDYYSFLMLNSIGTTKAKQGSLLAGLLKFKEVYDANRPLDIVLPALVKNYPETYSGVGVKDHCDAIHNYYKEHRLLDKMQAAFQVIPEQAIKPSEAYHAVVRKNVEYVELSEMKDRIPAVMVVPYPPGIPIIMGGEILNSKAQPVFDYLMARQDFENVFPGYESDIHGVERIERGGKKYFKTMCLKK